MAISTSARTFGGYFCPLRVPFTVFLQYARLATALPPLCRKAHAFALRRACFVPLSLPCLTAQNYCGHFARSSFARSRRRRAWVAAPSVCCAPACILLAAAPASAPCFRHWRRSPPLQTFESQAVQTGRVSPSHPSRKAPLARGAALQRRRQADCKAERFSSHISPAAAAYIPTVLSASSSLW